MRRFWLVAICLFWAAEPLAQERGPEEILQATVSISRDCPHKTERFDIDENGKETLVESDKEDKELEKMLTLSFLFRPKRFQLSMEKDGLTYQGRAIDLMSFFPKPEKEHLVAPPGASNRGKSANWGMNRMVGTIRLDHETGGIIRIKGDTPPNLKARKYLAFSAALYRLDFTHEQKLVGNEWLPESTTTFIHFTASLFGKQVEGQRSVYRTKYHCD